MFLEHEKLRIERKSNRRARMAGKIFKNLTGKKVTSEMTVSEIDELVMNAGGVKELPLRRGGVRLVKKDMDKVNRKLEGGE